MAAMLDVTRQGVKKTLVGVLRGASVVPCCRLHKLFGNQADESDSSPLEPGGDTHVQDWLK
jgi:hypothetical protein